MLMKTKYTATALALLLAAAPAFALQEGVDYETLAKPIPQQHSDKIEVLEFFSYNCVHCYHLDNTLLTHVRKFPSDTYLRTVHIVWSPEYLPLARIAAAVNDTGSKYQADPLIFDAMFKQNVNLGDPETFKAWAARQTAFDSKKLLASYNSVNNLAQAKQMQDMTNKYGIDATPTVIVGGKYKMKFPSGFEKGMDTMDALIAKVRSERGMKASAKPRKAAVSAGAALAGQANR